ncbi:MAG: hypothetical protein F4X14_10485 [Caldilineaceae bacterium SB0661_bin_32]|uniref:Leucine/isoleucine/valine transporter permease subunit n=1 Tax=Caldilineaceae bacterium SB0661_bin_32 TaxID=2605255 RepID=A0A6B1D724_9CHLR|nr:hypothetical protein [Caldilineaceae bacterium SB0661_bin_32]
MPLESATRAVRTGLVAFAFLSYLILIGIPGRIGGPALPVMALIAALFFWVKLRRESIEPSKEATGRGQDGFEGKPGWEIGPQAASNGSRVRELLSSHTGTALVLKGLLAGLTTGLLIAIVSGIIAAAMGNGIAIQPVLDKIVPLNAAALIGVSPGQIAQADVSFARFLLQVLLFTGAGILAALAVTAGSSDLTHAAPVGRLTRHLSGPTLTSAGRYAGIALPFVLLAYIAWLGLPGVTAFGTNEGTVRLLLTLIATGSGLFALRLSRPGREQLAVAVLLGLGVVTMPFILDQFQNSVMGLVFIFVMMGLGLNIVVGYAGLLDLGYVAFFAIGAYTYAFLSAPFSSPYISGLLTLLGISPESPLLGYWMALPVAMLTAAVGGILLGIPVLRMRGDYLAIVTLGFGEIIRLFMLNLGELTNGPRGILEISQPALFGLTPVDVTFGLLSSQGWIFLLALISSALVAFVAIRLNESRLGRAWFAMQEDEDVAEATGVHLVRTKLLAFAIGATFAGMAGQLYAARQINIFPENFSLFVSIDALALIIVGGIGSPAGIVLGALALKGLPEVLRGVDEYRIVTFAALLVIMMIVRPDGILPSARRRIQLADPDEPGMDSDPETREEEPGLTVNGDAFADGSGGREEQ